MITHHPSQETLEAFASGALRGSAALVAACHLEVCDVCRSEVALWSDVGAALLLDTPPAELETGALESVLARLDEERAPAPASLPRYLERFNIPRALQKQKIGMRLWLAPGIWFAPLRLKSDPDALTYLVYGAKNTMLPQHTHAAREYTALLAGSYSDNLGTFVAGDFEEADETVHHAPSVTQDSECLCLISSDAPMLLEGLSARVIQTLAGRRY